jgi:N-acetylglucosaminyldiphosphoundecaprenol N-acetyl-beta-D-mannosaminyltransferase
MMAKERYYIDKIGISKVNLRSVLTILDEALYKKKLGYICVTNTRTSYLANQDQNYCQIQNNSLLTVPDGTPLVWIAKNRGFKNIGKCSGKDLMEAVFNVSKSKNYSHYFYGCSEETINKMQVNIKKSYSNIDIRAAISPPFQPLEKFDLASLAKEINAKAPTFFWCGLGAPKQEKFISLLQPKLENTICIGVGLAFEYFAGTVNRVPKKIEKLGLEWLYRCFQQPLKARRFIVPFFWMGFYLIKEKLIRR